MEKIKAVEDTEEVLAFLDSATKLRIIAERLEDNLDPNDPDTNAFKREAREIDDIRRAAREIERLRRYVVQLHRDLREEFMRGVKMEEEEWRRGIKSTATAGSVPGDPGKPYVVAGSDGQGPAPGSR